MRFAPPDDEVTLYETVFEDDFLGRRRISERLSQIVDRIEDPLVIALDGRWGTGKTYFLQRWVGAHEKQNSGRALAIYFDAFANDYLSDPLVALVATVSNRLAGERTDKLDRVKRAAMRLIKPGARIGLAVATAGMSEAFTELAKATTVAVSEEAKTALEDFWEREAGRQLAFDEFRSAIEQLTTAADGEESRPLVIVVDELDRCRPDYALEVLEVIKHFFAVPHVHFILGANLLALENSVRARYGPDIDASRYLMKFISFNIRLPEHIGDRLRTPATIRYAEELGEKMELPDWLRREIHAQLGYVAAGNEVSIREVGKILSSASLIPEEVLTGKNPYKGWIDAMVTLLIARIVRPEIFHKLLKGNPDISEIKRLLVPDEAFICNRLEGGERNPKFEHGLWKLFKIWQVLSSDFDQMEPEERRSFARAFDDFGDLHNRERIPQIIVEKWLDVFPERTG